ncbi:hypothetical protein HN451_07550 [archaeon]|jgi:predicted nucleotidyltransferase|nr:hypothetical protein [archaeon]
MNKELTTDKKLVLKQISKALNDSGQILSARIYGSWLYNEKSVDLDVAIMIPSQDGIVEPDVYRKLYELRKSLCDNTRHDIDLIPHTTDEKLNINSPLWYPRYNPSLVFGKNIKDKFPVQSSHTIKKLFNFSDLTAYVLFDNRTICRRQLVRSLNEEEARIFVSKLLHGPGNALSYYSYKNGLAYICPPSDLSECFVQFDKIYNVDSTPAMQFINQCKKGMLLEDALKLIHWYEHLIALIFHKDDYLQIYRDFCINIEI